MLPCLVLLSVAAAASPSLSVAADQPSPVITVNSTPGIKYGFEGGNAVKVGGSYHLVTTELTGDPRAVKTRLAHWRSDDLVGWSRVGTLFESSGDFTGRDPRAALWGPMFVYDDDAAAWSLFYVAYRAAPNIGTQWRINFAGAIWRAVSRVKGPGGIDGPYDDTGVALQPDAQSQPWEGLQGVDSFFPYRVGNRWLAFYGSADTAHRPVKRWAVGLAQAPRLAGPWTRCEGTNPVALDPRFAENPVVTPVDGGGFFAVYDNEHPSSVGYAWSPDGLNWNPGRDLRVVSAGPGHWARHVRTPLGLVPEGNNRFTMLYTGFQNDSGAAERSSVGWATVALEAP